MHSLPRHYGVLKHGFSPSYNPTALPRWWAPNKGRTAVCSCHCQRDTAVPMREVLAWPWVGVCVPLALVCTSFNAIELRSIYFFINYLFYDISKQIQQRARIGKIFARWHLAIAITSLQFIFFSKQPFNGNYMALDSHANPAISHAVAYSSKWLPKP